jgi:plastocyanin
MLASTRTLAALALCALILTSCGGSGAAVRERSHTVAITLDDYLIRPQTLHIPSGATTFHVTNRGRLGHTFRIRAKTRNVAALTTLQPGETKTKRTRLAPGTYTIYCVLANHEELGMYATLKVG